MELILKYFPELSAEQLRQFEMLDELYRDWNSRINVISRKDIDSLYEKHVLHSLSIAVVFDFDPGTTILDIGTGGGFPGIPLAIYFPEVKFHLVDSIAKKIKVVTAIAAATGLKNVTAEQGRAEEIKNRKFDFVTSRAVAPLKELWSWTKPLLRKSESGTNGMQGGLICLKGGELALEISDSRTRPRIIEIFKLFPEEYFKEKYILHIPR